MKEILFNEKKYQAPESWPEVTLRMVIRTSQLDALIEDAPIISIIAGYCDIPTNELKLSKVNEMQEILTTLEFIYEPYKPTPGNFFILNGITYACEEDILDQTFETWVSTQTILYNYREDPVAGLPRMIATLCKKEGETLDDINLDKRTELFLDLPITIAKDIESFFLNSLIALRTITQLYSSIPDLEKLVLHKFNELSNMMKAQQERHGLSLLMKCQIGLYRIYLEHIRKLLVKSFNSQLSKGSKKTWMRILKGLLMRMQRKNK